MHSLVTELRASEPKFHTVEKAVMDAVDEEDSEADEPLIAETSEPVVLCEFA
jgi:hypothetical protein